MNYNSDLPGGKQATKGDKNINRYILYGLFPFVQYYIYRFSFSCPWVTIFLHSRELN